MDNELTIPKDGIKNGSEWHLEFTDDPEFPYPFPIVTEGARPKRDAVGHLSRNGTVHVFNDAIIERLVRAGLRARVRRNEAKADCGYNEK